VSGRLGLYLALALLLVLCGTPVTALAQSHPALIGQSGAAEGPTSAIVLPDRLTAEQVDGLLAGLTDAQVRQLLSAELHREAEAKAAAQRGGDGGLGVWLVQVRLSFEHSADMLRMRAGQLALGLDQLPGALAESINKVAGGRGFRGFLGQLASLAVLLAVGMAGYWLVRRLLAARRERVEALSAAGFGARLTGGALRSVYNLLAIGAFALVAMGLSAVFFAAGGADRTFVVTYITGVLIILGAELLSRFLLAPEATSLRLVPLGDATARFLHRWFVRLAAVATIAWLTAGLLILTGMPLDAHLIVVLLTGAIVAAMLIVMILQARASVAETIRGKAPAPANARPAEMAEETAEETIKETAYDLEQSHAPSRSPPASSDAAPLVVSPAEVPETAVPPPGLGQVEQPSSATTHGTTAPAFDEEEDRSLREQFAETWHIFAILYVIVAWVLWGLSMLARGPSMIWAATLSVGVLLLLPLFDRMSHRALCAMLRSDKPEAAPQRERYIAIVQRGVRVVMAIAAGAVLLQLWGVNILGGTGPMAQAALLEASFDIAVAGLLAYLGYQFVKVAIDRRLVPRVVNGETVAPSARVMTLLPLFRKFFIAVLIIMTVMLVLSALGVNIGPLLAGAGVVGIAIGFGAQALVRDIMSGIFFLIEDAFRVGEYIEMGELRGEVETISLRSLRLRHHRGPLHTVPYGELRSITNHNRDWTIYKMNFRVPFDTDIDTVKKLMKEIGREMMADPDLGPRMLEPLKSQGVLEIDDSGMVIRVKFTCKPREQFILRREAYKRIKAKFEANGIEFARRKVEVHTASGALRAEDISGAAAAAVGDPGQSGQSGQSAAQ